MKTDCDFLVEILSDGKWHSNAEILGYSIAERGVGMTVHSRIAELRDPAKRGLEIEYRRVRGERGQAHQYRLVTVRAEQEQAERLGPDGSPALRGSSHPLGDPPSRVEPGRRSISPGAPTQLTVWEAAA